MAIKVHGISLSTCTARVLLCLHEKGLEYELVHVDVASGAHKKQPYLSLNVRAPFHDLIHTLSISFLASYICKEIHMWLTVFSS